MAPGQASNTKSVWVTIHNWEKHNPRKDIKRPTWFALDNRMVEHEDLFDLTHGEFKAWIYMLSLASRKTCETIEIPFSHADRVCKIKPREFRSALQKLANKNMITVHVTRPSHVRDIDVGDPNATYIQTDNTDRQDMTDTTETESSAVEVIEPLRSELEISDFVRNYSISEHTQGTWLKLYELEYIRREVIKATDWVHLNPRKRPKVGKGAATFMSGWLSRSYEAYRKSIPTNSKTAQDIDWDRVFNQPGSEATQ